MRKSTEHLVRRCLEPHLSRAAARVRPTANGQVAVLHRAPACYTDLLDALSRLDEADVRKGCAAIVAAGCHMTTARTVEAALAALFSGQDGLLSALEAAMLVRGCRERLAHIRFKSMI